MSSQKINTQDKIWEKFLSKCAGEMTQQLKALVALPEEPSSISNTHNDVTQQSVTPGPKDLTYSSGL